LLTRRRSMPYWIASDQINKKISLGYLGGVDHCSVAGLCLRTAVSCDRIATSVRVVGGSSFLGPANNSNRVMAAFVGRRTRSAYVFADPANTEADWNFFSSLGVDAIYSVIPLGVQLQPVILISGWSGFSAVRLTGRSCLEAQQSQGRSGAGRPCSTQDRWAVTRCR
jgi:hypothetical protein